MHTTAALQNIVSGGRNAAIFFIGSSAVHLAVDYFFKFASPDWLMGLEGETFHTVAALAIIYQLKAVTFSVFSYIE